MIKFLMSITYLRMWEALVLLFAPFIIGVVLAATWRIDYTNQYDEFLKEAIEWVGENSNYDVSGIDKLPSVVLADPELINILWNQRNKSEGEEVTAFFARDRYVDGKEITTEYKMYIARNTDLRNRLHAKTLVHEIVHYIQFVTGYYDQLVCKNHSEVDAYNLAIKWLEQQGFTNEDFLDPYRALATSKSSCK